MYHIKIFRVVLGTLFPFVLLPSSKAEEADSFEMFKVKGYSFTRSHPPRLADTQGDVYRIPDRLLVGTIGEATWVAHISVPAPPATDGTPQFLNTDRQFKMIRRQRWALDAIPIRYGTDKEITTKQTVGWSKTDKDTMEKSLDLDAKADLFKFLSVDVKASLHLTSDVTNEWHEETQTEVKQTFLANHIYCSWKLYDQLDLEIQTKISTDVVDKPASGNTTQTSSYLRNVIALYEDSAEDKTGSILAGALMSFQQVPFTIQVGPPRIE